MLLRAPDQFGGHRDGDDQCGSPIIRDGKLIALEQTGRPDIGLLTLPALTEPHCHLDKCHTIGRIGPVAGDLSAAIAAQMEDKENWTAEDIRMRASRGLLEAQSAGVAALRSHVDWGDGAPPPLAWNVLREIRQEAAGITMQLSPLTGIDRMAEHDFTSALAREAAAIDGALGAFIKGHARMEEGIRNMMAAAMRHGLPLDFHVDEGLGDYNGLEMIADIAIETGFDGPILCGHAVSLIDRSPEQVRRIADKLLRAGISVCALPTTNLYLQDRCDGTPNRRGLTRLQELRTAKVPVLVGSDNVADAFCPLGQFDPMAALHLAALAAHLDPPMARWLPMITTDARHAMGLPPLYVDDCPVEMLRMSDATDTTMLVSGRSPLRQFNLL